jgi:hypothetical protein
MVSELRCKLFLFIYFKLFCFKYYEHSLHLVKYHTSYKHIRTGAEILSVQAVDENKVFGVTFRTPPHVKGATEHDSPTSPFTHMFVLTTYKDSTGVPHILEHSVLCGSKKYTSKEPFVELLKGSLQVLTMLICYQIPILHIHVYIKTPTTRHISLLCFSHYIFLIKCLRNQCINRHF